MFKGMSIWLQGQFVNLPCTLLNLCACVGTKVASEAFCNNLFCCTVMAYLIHEQSVRLCLNIFRFLGRPEGKLLYGVDI